MNWDQNFIEQEQLVVAWPIYNGYKYGLHGSKSIAAYNNMQKLFETMGWLIGMPQLSDFGNPDLADQEMIRVDLPMLMLYPDTYKPLLQPWSYFRAVNNKNDLNRYVNPWAGKLDNDGTLNAEWTNYFKTFGVWK